MEEIWKPIPGYEGLYDASSLGRIRSAPGKTTSSARFKKRVWNSRVLKAKVQKHKSRNDERVDLWKNGEHHTCLVARLVAMAFHGVPDAELTVNHINGNSGDNRPENLEWVTRKENNNHAHRIGLCAAVEHPICLIDGENNVYRFRSESEACRFLNRSTSYIYDRKRNGYLTVFNANGANFRIIPLTDYWERDA